MTACFYRKKVATIDSEMNVNFDQLFCNVFCKFAAKTCKHFPPSLNNVSTLPCET